MAATKEYVDKMCFGSTYYYPWDSPPQGKSVVLNPSNNKGIYFKKENNNFAPLFVGNYYNPIFDSASQLFGDKVVNKYEVDKMCKKIKWKPDFYFNRSYFKTDISFSPAPIHVPNSPPDNPLYDLKNYELYFTSPSTSTKITLPPTSTRITLWYPDIKRYSNIYVGVRANYFSEHFSYYSTSVTDYLLYPPLLPKSR
jgi:adenine specific DNA methylase Mod